MKFIIYDYNLEKERGDGGGEEGEQSSDFCQK